MTFVPSQAFFTRGIGRHKNKLQSFELALRDAKIEKLNLVYVSSIFPPQCRIIELEEGVEQLHPGQITYCVMAKNATNEKGRLVGSAVGMAFPADESHYGYISEHHASARKNRRSVTSLRIWPPQCLPPLWESILTRTRTTTSAARSIS
jgi:arginine decarboxylase